MCVNDDDWLIDLSSYYIKNNSMIVPLFLFIKFDSIHSCSKVSSSVLLSIHITDKKTDAWWDIFITWKIDFGLLAVAWAGLWNKMFGPIMSNFWGRFFQLFVGKKKKKIFWKHCSVRTEKLHRKKVKKIFIFFGKNFFFQKNQFFLGLKIWVYILRPSDQTSVSFYCVCILWSVGTP